MAKTFHVFTISKTALFHFPSLKTAVKCPSLLELKAHVGSQRPFPKPFSLTQTVTEKNDCVFDNNDSVSRGIVSSCRQKAD